MPSDWSPLAPFHPDGGLHLRLARGPLVRPLSIPWVGPNPWTKWNWAVLRLPRVALPFLSYNGRWFHGYIGGKTFRTGPYPDPGHAAWMRPEDADKVFVTPSARLGWGVRR